MHIIGRMDSPNKQFNFYFLLIFHYQIDYEFFFRFHTFHNWISSFKHPDRRIVMWFQLEKFICFSISLKKHTYEKRTARIKINFIIKIQFALFDYSSFIIIRTLFFVVVDLHKKQNTHIYTIMHNRRKKTNDSFIYVFFFSSSSHRRIDDESY